MASNETLNVIVHGIHYLHPQSMGQTFQVAAHTHTVGTGKVVLLCVHEVKKQEYFKEASTSPTFIIAISSWGKRGSDTSKATLVNPRNGQS